MTDAVDAVDAFWADQTSCDPADFDVDGVAVVERPAADGSEYALLLRRKERIQIACSPPLASILRSEAGAELFDPDRLRRLLGDRVDRIVGPAYLGYLDAIEARPDPSVRMLAANDDGALAGLRETVSEQDWEYSGIEPEQPIGGCFVDGVLVAAAGYEVWAGTIAHIGVVARPDARGGGRGRACVRAIAAPCHRSWVDRPVPHALRQHERHGDRPRPPLRGVRRHDLRRGEVMCG